MPFLGKHFSDGSKGERKPLSRKQAVNRLVKLREILENLDQYGRQEDLNMPACFPGGGPKSAIITTRQHRLALSEHDSSEH